MLTLGLFCLAKCIASGKLVDLALASLWVMVRSRMLPVALICERFSYKEGLLCRLP